MDTVYLQAALFAYILYRLCSHKTGPLARKAQGISARVAPPAIGNVCTEPLPSFAFPPEIHKLEVQNADGTWDEIVASEFAEQINSVLIPELNTAMVAACQAKGIKGIRGRKGNYGPDGGSCKGPKGDAWNR